jgi:hypothetical protein
MTARIRLQIAQEAARILAQEGIHDLATAKRKAASRLGINETAGLPRNEEIEAALLEHHRLFRAETQPRHIERLRRLALEAMRFLADFSPVLTGGVWDGTGGEHAPIHLHVFTDSPEDLMQKLMSRDIPFEEGSHSPSKGPGRPGDSPALGFYVDKVRVVLKIHPADHKGRTVGKKGNRAQGGNLMELGRLLGPGEPAPPGA